MVRRHSLEGLLVAATRAEMSATASTSMALVLASGSAASTGAPDSLATLLAALAAAIELHPTAFAEGERFGQVR